MDKKKKTISWWNSPPHQPHLTACLNPYPDDWNAYARSFKATADWLVLLLATNKGYMTTTWNEESKELEQKYFGTLHSLGNDTAIYPILYLYRHYLELALKSILYGYAAIEKKAPPEFFTHKLQCLWEDVQEGAKRTDKMGGAIPVDIVSPIDKVIEHFGEIDLYGDACRYPCGKDQKKCLEGLHYVNICQLSSEVGEAYTSLDRIFLHVIGEIL